VTPSAIFCQMVSDVMGGIKTRRLDDANQRDQLRHSAAGSGVNY
jgi:hypothetical protein